MRRVSGKVSLATRRIWGDPEDEDELCAITSSELRFNRPEFTSSSRESSQSISAYNDGISSVKDPRVSADCISFPEAEVRAMITYSGQALKEDGELPLASKRQNSPLDEKYALSSTNIDTPNKILYNSSTKITLLEQSESKFKKTGDSSFPYSISSSAVRPPLSHHDASNKDLVPCEGNKLTKDHSEAPLILQDLDTLNKISHQCLKENIEDLRAFEGTAEVENRNFAHENFNPQENVIITDGPCLGKHKNDLNFENTIENKSLIPMVIESEDIISRNCDPYNSEGKLQLNSDVSEFDNDNIPEIVPSKLDKLESCDEKISTNLESEIPQVSFLFEIENQSKCKSNSESHLQLYSEDKYNGNEALNVVLPITVNDNCIDPAYMSSCVSDLSNPLVVENKQSIENHQDKKTSKSLDLSDEITSLDQALPLNSRLELKNNARNSVSLDEEKSSRCTEITEYACEEIAKSITSDSVLNIAKDESNENNLVDLNAHEGQVGSQIIGFSNEEVDEDYKMISVFDNLFNKIRVSDTKFTENHDSLRETSNKYNGCTKTLISNVQESNEHDNNLSLSDGNEKYDCNQSSGLNLAEILDQHNARDETMTYEVRLLECDNKPNDIPSIGTKDIENLSEKSYTANGETSPNHNPDNFNNTEFNVVNTDDFKINVKDFNLGTDKNFDLKNLNETEIRAEVRTEENFEETIDRIADTTMDSTEDKIVENIDRIVDLTMDSTEDKIVENIDRIVDLTMDGTKDISEEKTKGKIKEIEDRTKDVNVDTTADRIEDKAGEKFEEIVDATEDTNTDTFTDTAAGMTKDRIEEKNEEKIEEIVDATEDTNTDTFTDITAGMTKDRIEEKNEEKIEEIIGRIGDRTEGNANNIVESRVTHKLAKQGENQARDDIKANVFTSEAIKPENEIDENNYTTNEVDGLKNAHGTDMTISNDVKIESVVPIDQKFGKDNKKLQLKGAEISETETMKSTRNRRTWLRYVKSFEKRHEEDDSSSIKLSSGRESSGRSERGDRNETISLKPKIPETPMKKKYTPSQSGSTTPDNRRRSFRKKIKEKISDTLHKLKD
ncbi:hypothetical protein OnM2_049009 [Erysiphe neolycopersici]|uniref:Uncharacterized protein n=1 Tax=Erysiphe neolycopersici TaxID=212602 RepID=A0A420HT27_9PEZI|nr:hypothetical protein OnM2_049009 [Erysiphe neolycopersici]